MLSIPNAAAIFQQCKFFSHHGAYSALESIERYALKMSMIENTPPSEKMQHCPDPMTSTRYSLYHDV